MHKAVKFVKRKEKHYTDIHLQLRLRALAGDGALDKTVWISLGSENGRVLARVLNTLMP
jgi:hypothetical protein